MSGDVLSSVGMAALVGTLAMVAAARMRIPAIVLLLTAGALLGGSGLGWVHPEAMGEGLRVLVELAVAVILFEGALSLRMSEFRANSRPIRNLLTIGALITFLGASALAYFVLGFSFRHAVLTGSILIVTGPTVVTPLLRHIRPKAHLGDILRWEGILIDPIGALAAAVVLEAVLAGDLATWRDSAGSYGSSLLAGTAVGVAAGLLLDKLLRREGLVEEDLRSPLALAIAFAAFAGAEQLVKNAGLFAATIAGLVLTARHPPGLEDIERFKGRISSFVLGIIFVLLAGVVDLGSIVRLGWRGPLFLLGLVAVRAMSVGISTLGSGLTLGEKTFLTWVAPRGIVAAAVASLFSEVLEAQGDPGSGAIVGATFLVIVSTVVIQGLTARPLARRLGLLASDPKTVVIVGAERFGRLLAGELANAGVPVAVVDTNPRKLSELEGPGITAVAGDAHDEDDMADIDYAEVALVLAATPNDAANALVCAAFMARVGEGRVTQLPSGPRALERGSRHAATRYPFAFGERLTRESIESALSGAGVLRTIPIEGAVSASDLRERLGTDFRPLVTIAEGGAIGLIREYNVTLLQRTRVIGIETRRGEALPAEARADSADPAGAGAATS